MGLYNVVVFVSLFNITVDLCGPRNISRLLSISPVGYSLFAIFNLKFTIKDGRMVDNNCITQCGTRFVSM
jgi:hypothetical protein